MLKRVFGAPTLPALADDDPDHEFEPTFVRNSTQAPDRNANAYSLLMGDDSEPETADLSDTKIEPEAEPEPCKREKKKKNKKKNKKSSSQLEVEQADEVARCVREVNALLGEPAPAPPPPPPPAPGTIVAPFLAVDNRHLSVLNEVRTKFGFNLMKDDNPNGKLRKQWSRKSTISYPKQKWPPVRHTDLHMKVLKVEGDITYFQFTHGQTYQRVQRAVLDAIDLAELNFVTDVLELHPYHIDALLQLASVVGMSGDYTRSQDFIEKSIHALEHVLHPAFNYNSGKCRLEYTHYENRCFHIAVLKYVRCMYNMACHRTALELCKLLLSLDPSDPLAVIMVVDSVALRAKQHRWLVDMVAAWRDERSLLLLPNIAFSHALAKYAIACKADEDTTEADNLLLEAIQRFPGQVKYLLEKCSSSRVEEFNNTKLEIEDPPRVLLHLMRLYAMRAWPAWKERRHLQWLETVALRCAAGDRSPIVEFTRRCRCLYARAPTNLLRHLVVLDHSKVPLLNVETPMPIRRMDPYPPGGAAAPYPVATSARRDESSLMTFLRSLLPTYVPAADAPPAPDAPNVLAGGHGDEDEDLILQNFAENLLIDYNAEIRRRRAEGEDDREID